MSFPTRRDFLATTSAALVGTALGTRRLGAQSLPAEALRSSRPPSEYLRDPMAAAFLRTLATNAVNAARDAGASYADVRVAEAHELDLPGPGGGGGATIRVMMDFTFGIRVIVDGAMTFVHGTVPTVDAVTIAARNAVASARGVARVTKQRVVLAPVPVVTGEWTTPMILDPFNVPIHDQMALLFAYAASGNPMDPRVLHGGSVVSFRWSRETRVFASTEGSLVTQTLRRSKPLAQVLGTLGEPVGSVSFHIPSLFPASGGYETVSGPGIQDEIKQLTEDAVELARLPRKGLDVGRYPMVADGRSCGALLGNTLGTALTADRALGYLAADGSQSYLTPPAQMVGSAIASPVLTVEASCAVPHLSAVGWDDDGVAPDVFPLIRAGKLMTYLHSRQTAGEVGAQMRGGPPQRMGCAIAPTADAEVRVQAPHLSVAPSASRTSLSDLYKDMERGILMRSLMYTQTERDVGTGHVVWYWANMFEISRGKIVARLNANDVVFSTRRLWNNLLAVGDASTLGSAYIHNFGGIPYRESRQSTTAPAALFKDVDVVSTKVSF